MASTDLTTSPIVRIRQARQIAELRSQSPPMLWADVSKRMKLSQSTCQRRLEMLEEYGDPDFNSGPLEWVQQHFDSLTAARIAAWELWETAPSGHSVQAAAITRVLQSSQAIFELAARVGFVPRQLGVLSVERQMQEMFLELQRACEDYGASDELVEALARLSNRRLSAPSTVDGMAFPVE